MADDKSPKGSGTADPKSRSTSPPKMADNKSPKGSVTASPKSRSTSPPEASSQAPAIAGILPAQHWVDTAQTHAVVDDDADSTSESQASTTASLSSSILRYRHIHGRTYHSEIGNASYWGSNDSQANDSMDINHHVLTLMLGGKLFLAPLETDKIQKVLDIGTGTGTWAIDFADEYPNIPVIGTDISPIQPGWVPPNLKFEIEDCTLDWTFEPESADYIHMRWLVGSVSDWQGLYEQAYRTLRPGGWIESYEGAAIMECDDGTVPEKSAMEQWGKIFINFGESIGRPFTVVADGIQSKAMRAAGFVDMEESSFKTPIGRWPKDPALKEIGEYAQAVIESDLEGYIMYPATALGWSASEISVYAAHVRKELRSPSTHPYYSQKVVWGQKPLNPQGE